MHGAETLLRSPGVEPAAPVEGIHPPLGRGPVAHEEVTGHPHARGHHVQPLGDLEVTFITIMPAGA